MRLRGRGIAAWILGVSLAATGALAQPANDLCDGATDITSTSFSESVTLGNTATTAGDVVAGSCSSSFTQRGIWYTYSPTQDQVVTITFFLSVTAPDTLTTSNGGRHISVFSGGCTTLTPVPAQGGASACVAVLTATTGSSTYTFSATAGTTYYFNVGPARAVTALPASATYNVMLEGVVPPPPPANDTCGGAISIPTSTFSTTVAAGGATNDDEGLLTTCESSASRGVWYAYTSTMNGRATFSFDDLGSGVTADTGKFLAAFTGACGSLTPVANVNASDMTCASVFSGQIGAHDPLTLSFDISTGVTYYILAAAGTENRPYPLNESYSLSFIATGAPTNDACGGATAIGSLPYSTTVNVGGATNSVLNVPNFQCVSPTSDVWYTYTPSSDQLVQVVFTDVLAGTDNGGSVGVYRGACGGLAPVACSPGDAASVFPLRAGTQYFFMVGRSRANPFASYTISPTDAYTFTISSVGTPPAKPANDECSTATNITSFPVSQTVAIPGANDDLFGPICFASPSDAMQVRTGGVWFTYTPASNQYITVRPAMISQFTVFNTMFYTGNCGSLTPYGCNGASDVGRQLTAGTTYYIYVGGFATSTSIPRAINNSYSLVISVASAPANDLCTAAETIPSLPYIDTTNIAAATHDAGGASCSGGQSSIRRGIWYSYTNSSGSTQPLAAWNSHGPGITGAMSVFNGDCNSGLLTCGDASGAAFFDAEPGQTYTTLVGDYGSDMYYLQNGPFDSTVEFHPAIDPTNTFCSTAYELASFPAHFAADSSLGSTANLPTGCNAIEDDIAYNVMYFTFTPAQSGTFTADISRSYGGDITVLYSGPCNNLTPISCTNNISQSIGYGYHGYDQPTLTAEVVAGTRYTLMLGINYLAESNVSRFNLLDVDLDTGCAADFNGVNGVTVQDIFDFLTAWLAGNPSANFNGVNGVTVQDIFDFLTAWLAGC